MRQFQNKPLSNSQRKKHLALYSQVYPSSVKIYNVFSKKFVRYKIIPREQMDWDKWKQYGHISADGYFHPECKKCNGFGSEYGYAPDLESPFPYKLDYIDCTSCDGSGWGDFVTSRR